MADSVLRATSSAVRTLDARDIAALRPAKANVPRTRRQSVVREVTNGIACFCGERFGEHQALEFMLHLRAEVGADLAVLERARAANRERSRKRNRTPEYRARERARQGTPEYRAKAAERHQRRMQDPESAAEIRRKANEHRRERQLTDPVFREQESGRQRMKRARRKEREAG